MERCTIKPVKEINTYEKTTLWLFGRIVPHRSVDRIVFSTRPWRNQTKTNVRAATLHDASVTIARHRFRAIAVRPTGR